MNASSPTALEVGQQIYQLAERLFPLNRSLTGAGVRETLQILQQHLPELQLHTVPSGQECFNWQVPREWNVREAYIADTSGNRVVDFANNNLHLMGYSIPIERKVERAELEKHLFSLPEQPDAIPYKTSYYKENWGFCVNEKQKATLTDNEYFVRIDSTLEDGVLNYADLVLPGASNEEVLFSTYICHPSMGNNETSGPCLTTFLANYVKGIKDRRYTYRFVFVPETIGAIVYLHQHQTTLKKNVRAGFVVTCVGDDHAYSLIPSRKGGTLADRIAEYAVSDRPNFTKYSFLQRGSDERQYCSPGIDLPVVSMPRSKYGVYPEYHTSLDDLSYISAAGFAGAWQVHTRAIDLLEANAVYRNRFLCEPQLGKYGLYEPGRAREYINFSAYCDGENDLLAIGQTIGVPPERLLQMVDKLKEADLIELA